VDGQTYVRTFFPSILLGRLSEVDLIKLEVVVVASALSDMYVESRLAVVSLVCLGDIDN